MTTSEATAARRPKPDIAALKMYLATVKRTARIARRIQEITFQGEDLVGFPSPGLDDFIYIFVPRPGSTAPAVGRDFTWDWWRSLPEPDRPVGRYYTVRRMRADLGEIDVWFVLHEAPGPLAAWAESAVPGSRAALWGPRFIYDLPPDASWLLLLGDETGLPAIAGILESMPASLPCSALIEAESRTDAVALPRTASAGIHWLYQDDGESLSSALASWSAPGGAGYVWAAAERSVVADLRTTLASKGIEADRMDLTAYWQR